MGGSKLNKRNLSPGMAVHTCNPSTLEVGVEAGESGVLDHLWLHNKLEIQTVLHETMSRKGSVKKSWYHYCQSYQPLKTRKEGFSILIV